MSCKRSFCEICDDDYDDYYDYDDDYDNKDIIKIINTRKLRKKNKTDIIGFCDCCEKLTTVHKDKEQPQFNYCNNCEANDLAFLIDLIL